MRIALYSRQVDGLKRLIEQLATDKRVSHLLTVPVSSPSAEELVLHNVDVLILDDLIGEWITPAELEKLSNAHPDVLIMLIARQDSSALFVDAVGAGVRSILRWPATPAEIDQPSRSASIASAVTVPVMKGGLSRFYPRRVAVAPRSPH